MRGNEKAIKINNQIKGKKKKIQFINKRELAKRFFKFQENKPAKSKHLLITIA